MSSTDQDAPESQAEPQTSTPQESPWVFWRGVLITLGVALGIRQTVIEARYIPSGSMLPGLQLQDRLLVEKLSYRRRPPQRGEIVVFHAPHHFDPVLKANHQAGPLRCLLVNLPLVNLVPGLQEPACEAYIKRVVAVAGDRVVINPRGEVTVNGQRLNEPYVNNYCAVDEQGMSVCRTLNATVPPGHVLVLGDNRANSWDGRYWPGGAFLPETEIIGRAFWRFWPLGTAGDLNSRDPLKPQKPSSAGAQG
ncbi:signal peptidase I [Synechococcus sp. HK05]|uniref:signal peptidase I n=1 Tax=Synechococcus sp. HK05 TaxID=2725975 RepID=UPI001C3951D0|nr:signal peptidase I [Synechococcus sp. HK05]MBV2350523.1 signal peptidase I [Synechococcus sp. HK05]